MNILYVLCLVFLDQGPKRYQEQRRKKDKKKEEETEGEKKVEENPNKERRNTDRNEGVNPISTVIVQAASRMPL